MNDYADAAERHFMSAEALTAHPATASHCYGISSECVLKALMSNLQPQNFPIDKAHLNTQLWSNFETSAALNSHPTRVAMAKRFQTHFQQWTVHQRYFNSTDTAFDTATVTRQQQGAKGLLSLLQQVQQGLI